MSAIVYHGTNIIIERPDCKKGREGLDFGHGFYVTTMREQAAEWAKHVAANNGGIPIINAYTIDREAILREGRSVIFNAYDEQWLDFVVRNRQGLPVSDYDYIEGGVANDRVVDSVRLYILGLIPIDVALYRLSMHQPNNQICLRTQDLIDKYLIYDGTADIQ